MSFKFINAIATFQTLINNILKEFLNKFVIVYLNDILIYFLNTEKYIKHVKQILKKFKKKRRLIKSKKCYWHVDEIEFLKHIVSHQNIRINSTKIKAIIKWSKFKTVKKIQSFIDLTNYYRKFIFEYSKCTAVLTNIIKKDLKFHWNAETQRTFNDFKKKFPKKFILANFDSELSKTVEANAFDRDKKIIIKKIRTTS